MYSTSKYCKLRKRQRHYLLLLLLLLLFTAIWLSPGGSGYFTCIQNMKLVTNKFKSEGLHEKNVVATWNFGNDLSIILYKLCTYWINQLNSELNPTCHLLALLEAHHILHISRIRVKDGWDGLCVFFKHTFLCIFFQNVHIFSSSARSSLPFSLTTHKLKKIVHSPYWT